MENWSSEKSNQLHHLKQLTGFCCRFTWYSDLSCSLLHLRTGQDSLIRPKFHVKMYGFSYENLSHDLLYGNRWSSKDVSVSLSQVCGEMCPKLRMRRKAKVLSLFTFIRNCWAFSCCTLQYVLMLFYIHPCSIQNFVDFIRSAILSFFPFISVCVLI